MGEKSLQRADYVYKPVLQWRPEVYDYLCKAYGKQRFENICEALTTPSIYSCVRVNTLQTTRREAMEKLQCILKQNSNPSNKEAVERMPRLLDRFQALQTSATHPKEEYSEVTHSICFEHPSLENVIMVKGSGPHQVDYDTETGIKEVVVSRKCAEAVLRGADIFVPGILACSSHVEKGDKVAVSVAVEQPDGTGNWGVCITRGTVLSSEHANSQVADSARKGWFIGYGVTLLSRAAIFRERQGIAVKMVNRVYEHPPFHGLMKGEIFLQNLPSIVAAKVLDPKPGECILDMCAAPGGKTTAIATLMEDKGKVVAIDRSHNKVVEILALAEEMNLTSIHAYRLDALRSVNEESTFDASTLACNPSLLTNPDCQASQCTATDTRRNVNWSAVLGIDDGNHQLQDQSACTVKGTIRNEEIKIKNGPGKCQISGKRVHIVKGFKPDSFDKVLLDPPCSALGLRPRLYAGGETLERLRQHGSYQKRMFDKVVQLVRSGGTIVYSTCTINPGENEAVVRYALDSYKFLSLVPQDPKLGGPGLVGGLDAFNGVSYKEWLRDDEKHLVQRFDPSSPLDTIGFFIAKFNVGSKYS